MKLCILGKGYVGLVSGFFFSDVGNILLNNIANQIGQDFDMDGELASKGIVDKKLLKS